MDTSSPRRIVVTGSNGQLGRQVVQTLVNQGHDVLGLDRTAPPTATHRSWVADITQPGVIYQALDGADAVVHLAAWIAPDRTDDVTTYTDNVAMTYAVLHAARACGLRRAVLASSIAAYGFLYHPAPVAPQVLPVAEDHPLAPVDPYGLSKVAGEQLGEAFARDALSAISLRLPGINYDPAFVRIKSLMSDPGFRKPGFWSYVDVRDAVTAVCLALDADLEGHRAYNIAAPTSNMREPTAALAARYFPDVPIRADSDTERWSGIDSGRARRELGFTATHVWESVPEGAESGGRKIG
ncbi:hypothetical protein BV394_11820 [Brevirhabdus pacifica]|uniref:Uncharacterized protein n=1 Tax=Brevirhabdus pacifica TaxID=1267768 RepID=A0A1U7DKC0_9RHOB|nr:NAD(P)-dependent oxidoreductase [Brevirhabdus pacifica]APX90329.1 hypothetical protein BV394_11820 [Brevirhabdus pacifica]PJJ80782.1 nucleoside-diphosphate-sugar epimerase [Brevirhabdus pacifica]